MLRIFVEIEKINDCYRGSIHQGNRVLSRPIPDLKLGINEHISIKGQLYKVDSLVQAIIQYKPQDLEIVCDERGQLEIGEYFYSQLFGDVHPAQINQMGDKSVDLRIITDDEHIAQLPWVLLAHKGTFLAATGWSISLGRQNIYKDCELPATPRMLVILPEPVGVPKTRAKQHLESLEYFLSSYDHHFSIDHNLKVAYNWEQFRHLISEFKPHIIYYYGHGEGDRYHSRLVFASGDQLKRIDKPIVDFAQCLKEMDDPPKIVYLNCCSGNTAGFLGAGWQLGEIIPSVVTNRTIAYIDAAQAQALAFWQNVLLEGIAPHRAMSEIRGKLIDLDMSFMDARWMTPVHHCHYANWKSTSPRRVSPLEHDPHWHLKLDRVVQFGTVAFQTRQMLREHRPRSLIYVWYGKKGQGVDIFHKRLNVELQEDLAMNSHFFEVRPEWPMELHDPDRSFSDMMCEAFNVHSIDDIPRSIRSHTRGTSGLKTLVYVRHQPIQSTKIINPLSLKHYLSWWDTQFAPLLTGSLYGLLTISFIVNNPAKFRGAMLNKEKLYDLEFSDTVFRLLDELEKIAMKDLFDFLQTHNIRLPRERKDQMLQEILERTHGNYELTISSLKKLVYRAWDETEKSVTEETETDFDY